MNSRPSRVAITVIGTMVLIGSCVVIAVLLISGLESNEQELRTQLARTLLTVAGAAAVSGLLGLAVSRARDREERHREDARFIETQVVQLWSARSTIRRSALLIATNKSAKTYGEQLQVLIDVRATVMNVRGAVRRRVKNGLRFRRGDDFRNELRKAVGYLSNLIEEYQENYKRISDLQRLDESTRKATLGVRSNEAWEALAGDGASKGLPVVRELIDFGRLKAQQVEDLSEEIAVRLTAYADGRMPQDPKINMGLDAKALMPLANAATLLEQAGIHET